MRTPRSASVFTPIHKVVRVRASQELAFRRFTAEIGSWWPLASHSVSEGQAETVVLEGRVGGRIVEKARGGGECVWGTVTAWEPPGRVAFTWHPGRSPEQAQDIEVRFSAEGERTRVDLVHRGFERLGTDAKKARRGYPIGWAYVLGLYAGRRGPFMLLVSGLTALLMGLARLRGSRAQVSKART